MVEDVRIGDRISWKQFTKGVKQQVTGVVERMLLSEYCKFRVLVDLKFREGATPWFVSLSGHHFKRIGRLTIEEMLTHQFESIRRQGLYELNSNSR